MIEILRLSHRIRRDKRLSSHVALVARAFGANKIYYSGQHDSLLENSVDKIVKKFGGPFFIEYTKNYMDILKDFKKRKGIICHLTMYGINLPNIIDEINEKRKKQDMLIIIGSKKVSNEFYKLSDFNVAIGNTPHSEVSSLSIFLYELSNKKCLSRKFKNVKLKIIPKEKGKLVKKTSRINNYFK